LQPFLHPPLRSPRAAAADRATALLGSDFSEITKRRHFAIDPVDCRSQSCVATLTWSEYRAASESVGDLLHRNFECASLDAALGSG
jgi:hypothetical protein